MGKRLAEAAVADAGAEVDAAGLELRGLEVDADAVGKRHEGDAEVIDGGAGGDLAGLAEVGVGPDRFSLDGGGGDGHGGRFFVGGGEQRGGIGWRNFGVTGDGDDAAGGGPRGAEGGEALGGGDLFKGRTVKREIGGRMREDVLRVNGGGEGCGERTGATRGGGFHGLLKGVDKRGGDLTEFGGGEAMGEGAAEFLVGDGERGGPLVGFAGKVDGGFAVEIVAVGHGGSAVGERGVFLFRESRKPASDDSVGERAREALKAVGNGVGLETLRRERRDRNLGGRRLDLGMVVSAEAGGRGDGAAVGRGSNGSAGRQRRERGNDLFFKGVDVEVADGNHGDFFGAIPGVVEVDELLARGALDDGVEADRETLWEQGIGEVEGKVGDQRAESDGVAVAFLRDDDTALFVDFLDAEKQAAGVVGENAQALVERGLIGLGQFEHVDGAVERGEGVGVVAEAHAETLENLDERAGWEFRAAVERHVLEEMGDTALGLGFVEGTGVDLEAERGAVLRLGVFEQSVAKTVGQSAVADGGIRLEVARSVGERRDLRCG